MSQKENGVMSSQSNPFLVGPLGPIYVKTALPIIFVMGMNGLLAVVDAPFVVAEAGHALDRLEGIDEIGWTAVRAKRYGRTWVTFFERDEPGA